MADDVHGEIIELTAVNPQGDLACDITVATEKAREGCPKGSARICAARCENCPTASRCGSRPKAGTPFSVTWPLRHNAVHLTLRAEQNPGEIVLSVTGRPEGNSGSTRSLPEQLQEGPRMNTRLQRLRDALGERELDGALISNAQNRRYLSGFTGSAGYLLITPDDAG